MDDEELDVLLHRVKHGERKLAAAALLEIAARLGNGRRLTGASLVALLQGLLLIIEGGKSALFLKAGRRSSGRPKGATAQSDLARAFLQYGAAKGFILEDQRTIGPRQQQRVRALLRGAPGKPGRPKKSDKK